jgi:hypothetical protein
MNAGGMWNVGCETVELLLRSNFEGSALAPVANTTEDSQGGRNEEHTTIETREFENTIK